MGMWWICCQWCLTLTSLHFGLCNSMSVSWEENPFNHQKLPGTTLLPDSTPCVWDVSIWCTIWCCEACWQCKITHDTWACMTFHPTVTWCSVWRLAVLYCTLQCPIYCMSRTWLWGWIWRARRWRILWEHCCPCCCRPRTGTPNTTRSALCCSTFSASTVCLCEGMVQIHVLN